MHFNPLITKVTRFSPIENERPSLLDHFWINNYHPSTCGIIDIDMTDHLPIFIHLEFPNNITQEKKKIQFRMINEANKTTFSQFLSETDWNVFKSSNVDEYTEKILEKLNSLYCLAFPLKTKFVSYKKHFCPWITDDLKKLFHAKPNYFLLYKLSLVSVTENNSFRNQTNKVIRKRKLKFYSDLILKSKNDLK